MSAQSFRPASSHHEAFRRQRRVFWEALRLLHASPDKHKAIFFYKPQCARLWQLTAIPVKRCNRSTTWALRPAPFRVYCWRRQVLVYRLRLNTAQSLRCRLAEYVKYFFCSAVSQVAFREEVGSGLHTLAPISPACSWQSHLHPV